MSKENRIEKGLGSLTLMIGIGFILLGIYFAIKIYFNYIEYLGLPNFRNERDFDKFANVLSGTTGLCFTLAGVIFLGYTLYQTRIEMRDTRDIFSTQLAESTFFQLMKYHTELYIEHISVSDIEGSRNYNFQEQVHTLRGRIQEYKNSIDRKSFNTFYQTLYSPNILYDNFDRVNLIGKSMVHITNFISTKLKTDERFYHNTFYFHLSRDEKWLLGLIIMNKLEPLKKYEFDYTVDYLANTKYINSDKSGEFVPLYVNPFHRSTFWIPEVNAEYFGIYKDIITNVFTVTFEKNSLKNAKLVQVIAKISQNPNFQQCNNYDVDFKVSEKGVEIYSLIERLLPTELSQSERVFIKLHFNFEFSGKDYWVLFYPFYIEKEEYFTRNEIPNEAREMAIKHNVDRIFSIIIRDVDNTKRINEAQDRPFP